MKINIIDIKDTRKINTLINNVIDVFKNNLFITWDFETKLNYLTINVVPYEKNSLIAGVFKRDEDTFKMTITLELFPDDNISFQFVLAHELTHMLFTEICVVTDFCRTDDTYAFSRIIRKNIDKKYGNALEEFLANYIAVNVISVLYNISYEESKERIRPEFISTVIYENFERFIHIFDDKVIFEPNDLYDSSNGLLIHAMEVKDLSSFIEEIDEHTEYGFWEKCMREADKYYDDYNSFNENKVIENFKVIESKIDKMEFMKARVKYYI